jgi:hypothetical protein
VSVSNLQRERFVVALLYLRARSCHALRELVVAVIVHPVDKNAEGRLDELKGQLGRAHFFRAWDLCSLGRSEADSALPLTRNTVQPSPQ